MEDLLIICGVPIFCVILGLIIAMVSFELANHL